MRDEEARLVRRFDVRRVRSSELTRVWDSVAIEEPLEIRLRYWLKENEIVQSLGLTMRTPGSDRELAIGWLLSEGVITDGRDIVDVRHLGVGESNEILIELAKHVDVESWRLARTSFANSSCGVCGKRSREAIAQRPSIERKDDLFIHEEMVGRLPRILAEQQKGFAMTGGLHGAALVSADGAIRRSFEDVGRHNALDKLVGWSVERDLLPLSSEIVVLSSRSSFELVQKLTMAGGVMLVSVGAPSSLAIETAREYGISLIGFVRENSFNVYSGDWRIKS